MRRNTVKVGDTFYSRADIEQAAAQLAAPRESTSIRLYGVDHNFSRASVEAALEELNRQPEVKNLTRVRNQRLGREGVVIEGQVQEVYTANFASWGHLTVVDENGQGSTYNCIERLLQEWDVVEDQD